MTQTADSIFSGRRHSWADLALLQLNFRFALEYLPVSRFFFLSPPRRTVKTTAIFDQLLPFATGVRQHWRHCYVLISLGCSRPLTLTRTTLGSSRSHTLRGGLSTLVAQKGCLAIAFGLIRKVTASQSASQHKRNGLKAKRSIARENNTVGVRPEFSVIRSRQIGKQLIE